MNFRLRNDIISVVSLAEGDKRGNNAQESTGTGPSSLLELYLLKKSVIEERLGGFLRGVRTGEFNVHVSPVVSDALEYAVMTLGGKRARPILVYLAHDLVGGSFSDIDEAAIIPELPHKGSLAEDDIDDNAVRREGKPPVFRVFGGDEEEGKAIAEKAYQLLYQSPALIINRLPIPEEMKRWLLTDYEDYARKVREGQHMELEYSRRGGDVRLGEIANVFIYPAIAMSKCGAFTYAVRVGAVLGGANERQLGALTTIADLCGAIFQARDDVISITEGSDDYGADITEGRINFLTGPIVMIHPNHTPDGRRLREILKMHTTDPRLIKEAVEITRKYTFFTDDQGRRWDRVEIYMNGFIEVAKMLLHGVFPASNARNRMEELIDFCRTGSLIG